MKSITQVVITGARAAGLQQMELNDQPGPGQILIDTELTVISPGTELSVYTGRDPKVHGGWCAWPWKAGYANVGIVRALGAGATGSIGQRVFTFGPHASSFINPAGDMAVPVPEGVDPVMAVASRMAGVACTSVLMADTACSPWVAVFGLGMVGNFAAQAFRILGCRVIGIDPNSERRTLAGRCGLTNVIAGGDDVVANIQALTGGVGPSIVVDATGLSQVILQAVSACAASGEVILLGTPRAPCPGDLTPVLADIHYRNLVLRGALEWNLPHLPTPGLRHSLASKQAMIFDWIQRGALHVKPLVSHVLPPGQVREAYEGLLNAPGTYTGVVLDWRQA